MGGKEKVPRPARVTQSGQEANRKRVAKAAGVRTGKRDQTKRAKAERATVLQEKEERFKSNDLLVPDKNATENPELLAFLHGTLGPEMPVAPFTRTQPNPEADWWRDQYLAELSSRSLQLT